MACLAVPRIAPTIAAVAALATAAALALFWQSGPGMLLDVQWYAPTGSRLRLELDPLGAPIAVFTALLAAAVLLFAGGYMPRYLADDARSIREQGRFAALMLAFMGAMVVLALAQDVLLIFLALELTAVISFLLIGFDREEPAARRAALTALVVTAASALAFLAGAMLIVAERGTTVLTALGTADVSTLAVVCLLGGTLAKSAQPPLHFWLPRAMIAPTPVSAYLHSAALVAAGVFVLIRLRLLFDETGAVLEAMQWLGLVAALLAGFRALIEDDLKRILAYSTIAQYGHVLFLIGAGGDAALVGAPLFIVAHGLCKAPLFMTAGAVTVTTGRRRLSQTGFDWRAMPALAIASAVAAAGLAGLPATAGYFKESLFFSAAADAGLTVAVPAVLAGALTIAYMARFWLGLFGGRLRLGTRPAVSLVAPTVAVAAALVLAGLATGRLEDLFVAATGAFATSTPSVRLEYSLAPHPELWLTTAAVVLGLGIFLGRHRLTALAGATGHAPRRHGTGLPAARLATRFALLSDGLRALEARDLRERIAAIVLPATAVVGLGLVAAADSIPSLGRLYFSDVPLIAALVATAVAAIAVTKAGTRIAMIMLLSFVGFGFAMALAVAEALEVALVVVVIETMFTLLFVAMLARMPPRRAADWLARGAGPVSAASGIAAGAMAFGVSWFALGAQHFGERAATYTAYTGSAHASDTVSAIVADFRALDTMAEITVLGVAVLGAIAISRRRPQ